MQQNATPCSFNTSTSWVILNPIEQRIKAKIEKMGTALKDWDISINYGIKTGLNDAFIVNAEQRNAILANCHTADERKRTDELLRPILRGRDIKRYAYEWAGLYLIATHNGIPEQGIPKVDVRNFPAIKRHLDKYSAVLTARTDQGDTPYNLRSCAYWEDFAKQKIVWGNLSLSASFSAAPEGMFVNAPCPMIVPFNGYLLAILNSRLGDWYIRQNGVTRNGGYFEYKPMFVERLPVPIIEKSKQTVFASLATQSNTEKQHKLDMMVYELYGLTPAEIAFIEHTH